MVSRIPEKQGAVSVARELLMKFYLDEDISPRVAEILVKAGIDAVSAHQVSMCGATDLEQLDRAAAEQRCMVTRNRNDFIKLSVLFFNEHRRHHGVLIVPYSVPGDQFGLLAALIEKFSQTHPDPLPEYTVDFIQS
jgi:hypothetical protein